MIVHETLEEAGIHDGTCFGCARDELLNWEQLCWTCYAGLFIAVRDASNPNNWHLPDEHRPPSPLL